MYPITVETSEDMLKNVSLRWYQEYGLHPKLRKAWDPDRKAVYDQLVRMENPRDRNEVEELIGNMDWTRPRCTMCYTHQERVVVLSAYDAEIRLCAMCLAEAQHLLQPEHRPERSRIADIAPDAVIGEGTKIWSFAVICPKVTIGRDCVIGSGVCVAKGATIGDGVHIQGNCFIAEFAKIGHRVFMGTTVTLSADKSIGAYGSAYVPRPPVIEDDVRIGSSAVILPGVRLGKGCVVGAGAVVTKDVPPGVTVIGNPARIQKRKGMMTPSSLMDDLGAYPELYDQVCACRSCVTDEIG